MNVREISQHNVDFRKGIILLGGWISAVLSLFIYPFVFGMVGVISGILAAKDEKSRVGVMLVAASIILMGIGLAFSNRLLATTMTYLGI
ncbi:hypothetical protein [Ruminiclostridium josui]|uniref:hypothetical protein n=1 Tax=Ruminiclostridium josui TaxID=1499 RepID=UPI0004678C61|nr:hypothetical protein [Ruminiclostridium josui]